MLCLLCALPILAQKKTFTAACLNVDGLPPTVKAAGIVNVKLNPEGPQETGTLQMSKLVSQKGWDFFGVSENFNYNTQLMSEIGGIYNTGTYRGAIPSSVTNVVPYLAGTKWFDTDGLNLLWRSNISVSDEAWYLWNKRNGITEDGADQLIAKGFRYYTVRIAAGLEVDVYILHMDAETTPADNEAREIQMTQLVDMILASDNKRPIIIMGDTNCRYTRDNLKGLMFERINADERFDIHDPWIDFPRGKVMPTLGAGSIMVPDHFDGTNHEAFQTGEVVDKIFYINNNDASAKLTAKSYLHDTDFTWPDGSEISDHYPIVIEFEIEKTVEALTGGEYYLRNVATGKFLTAGANWGTRAKVGRTGNRLTLEPTAAENTFNIKTTLSYLGDNLYMDNSNAAPYRFAIIDGTPYYTITLNDKALTVDADNVIQPAETDESDKSQQWEILTHQQLVDELNKKASATNPLDATFFIKGANFGRNDNDVDSWKVDKQNKLNVNLKDGLNIDDLTSSNFIGELYNPSFSGSGKSNGTITQNISGLPNGKYILTFQGFTRNGNNEFYVSLNGTNYIFPDIATGGMDTKIHNDAVASGGKYVPNTMSSAAAFFNEGLYTTTCDLTIKEHKLTILINKPHNKSTSTWTTFDNFVLTYLGPTDEDLAALNRVKAAIDDARAKATDAGLSSYSNRAVEDAYENRLITGDGTKEVHNTYIALAKAASKQIELPSDMRYAILNNSFEMGDLSEWDASQATGVSVVGGNLTGKDGTYHLTAAKGTLTYKFEVTMPDGIYELKAMLSPGAKLTAAGRTSAAAIGTENTLSEVRLPFLLKGGTTTVGVTSDTPFMADNFVLTRTGDRETASGYELIELAMTDATARINEMGSPYNDNWDLSKYQRILDELTLEGDGTREFKEIYGLLREQVYSQPAGGAVDYTNAIINPSFEFGTTLGWDATFAGDTGVKENSNSTYTFSSADGTYVFNTWDEGYGTTISQTIPGLPSGHYRLAVILASDQNNYVCISANDKKEVRQMERAKEVGSEYYFEFDVAKGTTEVTISLRGANADGTIPDLAGGAWYKADNFRLYRHDDGEMKTCDFYNRLQTAIRRLATLAAELPDKYRLQWDAHEYQDLIDEHVNSDHKDDPMGTNANPQIEELYARFRALVFSQTETDADMSGAIMNQSFELGDMTGWDIAAEPSATEIKVTPNEGAYMVEASELDGKYLFNSWYSDKSTPITQTLRGVPAGLYRLTAKVASDAGNRFYLAVNGTPGDMLTVTADKTHFSEISVDFEVTADEARTTGADIVLGLYPSVDGNFNADTNPLNLGPWFKADNFRLQLIGRRMDIKWAMEYPEEGYGTIILPFDANVPEDLEIHSLVKSKPSDALGDETYYQIAELAKRDKILANTPYIVTRKAATTKPEGAPQRRAAAAADANGVYTFSGITTHTQDTYESGFLTGSLVAAEPTDGDRHLMMNDGNIGFILHDNSDGQYKVEPYHAYISRNTKFTDGEGHDAFVSDVYFDEPETTVEWTMETALYGTIILPFDAEEPVIQGLTAFEITGLGEDGSYLPKGGTMEIEYQLINLTRVEDEIMKAYTPYLLFGSPTTEATAAEDDVADAPRTLTFKGKAADGTGATLENGLLKGVLTSGVQTAADDFILTYDNRNKEVFSMAQAPQTVAVNHAYIPQEKATGDAPSLLFFEVPKADDIQSGLQVVAIDSEAIVDVFSIDGITLRTGIEAAEALDGLTPGIYVLRTAAGATLKVLKR